MAFWADDLTSRGFDWIVPSLPGFAFTGGHALSSAETADLFQRSIQWFTQTAATAADSDAADGWGGEPRGSPCRPRWRSTRGGRVAPQLVRAGREHGPRRADAARRARRRLEVPQDCPGDPLALVE